MIRAQRVRRFALTSVVTVILMTSIGRADDPTFQAGVDRNQVGLDEQFTLSLTLQNAGMGGGKNLQLPDLSKFRIMSGPNQSSSMQFINGNVSSSVTYSYILQPKEIGKFTIGAATIEAGSKKLQSAPLALEVVKGSPKPKKEAAQNDATVQIGDNLFLKAVIDKSHAIQGEQINLAFKLYFRVSIANVGPPKSPTMAGFWAEDYELPKNLQVVNETYNGKQYRSAVIRKMALFPTQSGTLEISPMELELTVQVQSPRSADPFDAFFRDPFGRAVNYTVKSEALKIKVDPLPANAPPDFKGAVGQFAMSTLTDKKTTRTNEPISLKVTISGTGNVKVLESPSVELPADFEQYTPKVTDQINRTGEKINGSKTFEYLLIPRYPGLKTIKPVAFTYFDLAKHQYVELHSPKIELNVEQGTAPAPPLIAGGGREDVRVLSQDVRFIKLDHSGFIRPGQVPYGSAPFIVALVLPFGGLIAAWVIAKQRKTNQTDVAGYRNRRALKIARRGLKNAEYLLNEKSGPQGTPALNQRARFYTEVSNSMWKYLGDKLGIPQAEFSVDGAAAELSRRHLPSEYLTALRTLLETCDMARFAPTALELGQMKKTYDEASRIIVELERHLR